MGNLFTITGRMKCGISLASRKNLFYFQIYPYLNGYKERALCKSRSRDTFLGLLSTCLLVFDFRFEAMLGNDNSDAGRRTC